VNYKITTFSFLFVFGAIALPHFFWYRLGMREANLQARVEKERPANFAKTQAKRIAEMIVSVLENTRSIEETRDYHVYQDLYIDPKLTGGKLKIITSPLKNGTGNKIVDYHFQIDGGSKIKILAPKKITEGVIGQENLLACHPDSFKTNAAWVHRSTELNVENFVKNEQLKFYSRNHLKKIAMSKGKFFKGLKVKQVGPISVRYSLFQWRTLQLTRNEKPKIIGIRLVDIPNQKKVSQAFVISTNELRKVYEKEPFKVTFEHGLGKVPTNFALSLEGIDWHVNVQPHPGEQLKAAEQATAIVSRFQSSFTRTLIATSIAGIFFIGMIFNSERLSFERARFAASAAHELRTPLAGMRLYGEMLVEDLGNPEKNRLYANRIVEESERLNRVVTNVLTLTMSDKKRLNLQLLRGDLGQTVRDTVDRLKPALEAQGIKVELKVDSELPPVPFDKDAVFQILQNLLDNAEKYTRAKPNRIVEVSLIKQTQGLELSVEDNGDGIDAKTATNLFKNFSRPELKDIPAGLGLGLALSQVLAKMQGSEIIFKNIAGAGAHFSLFFKE